MTEQAHKTAIALTIAGSDSGGGAGIQADMKAMSALGVYSCSVLTALTAQNTQEVRAIHDLPVDFVRAQMETVFDDLAVGAVKIGMLSRADVIEAVAKCLKEKAPQIPIILDPVMVAKSGDKLLQDEAVEALRKYLLPLASLVTPNLPEAGVLLDRSAPTTKAEMIDMGQEIIRMGARSVLMKGGHLEADICHDILLQFDHVSQEYSAPRIQTKNTHGTGCTLSASIAAGLAKGLELNEAVKQAHSYLAGAIATADALSVGQGHGPVNHFYKLWSEQQDA